MQLAATPLAEYLVLFDICADPVGNDVFEVTARLGASVDGPGRFTHSFNQLDLTPPLWLSQVLGMTRRDKTSSAWGREELGWLRRLGPCEPRGTTSQTGPGGKADAT